MRSTTMLLRTPWALCLALLFSLFAGVTSASTAGAATTVASAVPTITVRGCEGYSSDKLLGASYADTRVRIYACGARPSFDGARNGSGPALLPFAGSKIYYRGYQCIELIARYLKARYDADPGVANGAQAVDRYAAAYPTKFLKIANGTKAKAPRKGDVLSLSGNRYFNDVGHTGIVSSSSVNSAGNGTVRAVEQNWGGTGGTTGYHVYAVKSWRVIYAGLPHVKWLRAR